jgi:hypothetical protein
MDLAIDELWAATARSGGVWAMPDWHVTAMDIKIIPGKKELSFIKFPFDIIAMDRIKNATQPPLTTELGRPKLILNGLFATSSVCWFQTLMKYYRFDSSDFGSCPISSGGAPYV